jgi:hypothetical protein
MFYKPTTKKGMKNMNEDNVKCIIDAEEIRRFCKVALGVRDEGPLVVTSAGIATQVVDISHVCMGRVSTVNCEFVLREIPLSNSIVIDFGELNEAVGKYKGDVSIVLDNEDFTIKTDELGPRECSTKIKGYNGQLPPKWPQDVFHQGATCNIEGASFRFAIDRLSKKSEIGQFFFNTPDCFTITPNGDRRVSLVKLNEEVGTQGNGQYSLTYLQSIVKKIFGTKTDAYPHSSITIEDGKPMLLQSIGDSVDWEIILAPRTD